MTYQEVMQYRRHLERLFEKIRDVEDEELKANWSKYLCVLTSGFLEISVRTIYGEYARRRSHPNVGDFVEGHLSRFQNPKMEKILQITQHFNAGWRQKLEAATEGELKDAVDSIVNNKNNIAHGNQVNITYGTMKRYFDDAVRVIEMIEDQCA
jgi:hypothetical protein